MDELMDTAEVARFCRTVPATVRYWRHQGTGPNGFRVGRRVLYRRSTVLEWLSRQESADQDRRMSWPSAPVRPDNTLAGSSVPLSCRGNRPRAGQRHQQAAGEGDGDDKGDSPATAPGSEKLRSLKSGGHC
jgi:hypothetical protein